MGKFVDSLIKITRIPEIIHLRNGEIQVSKNVGVAPDGTLRVMRPKHQPKPKLSEEDTKNE